MDSQIINKISTKRFKLVKLRISDVDDLRDGSRENITISVIHEGNTIEDTFAEVCRDLEYFGFSPSCNYQIIDEKWVEFNPNEII